MRSVIVADNSMDLVSVKLIRDRTITYGSQIRCSSDLWETVSPLLEDIDREVFAVINVNTRHQPINMNIVSMGAVNHTYVEPREVFKASILSNATDIFLCHNHPSGNVKPSMEDEMLTERLVEAGEILGLNVLDHIIVSPNHTYYSFVEEGKMQQIKENVQSRRMIVADRTEKFYSEKGLRMDLHPETENLEF